MDGEAIVVGSLEFGQRLWKSVFRPRRFSLQRIGHEQSFRSHGRVVGIVSLSPVLRVTPERILVVHNRYLIRGGEDESRETKDALLRERGHEVVEYVLDNKAIASMGSLRVGMQASWSPQAYREIREVIRKFRPDIIDVHNFFPLISPAVHYAAAAEGVPTLQLLSNYRLACLNGYFFREGAVCEKCLHASVPWPGIVHACYRDSRVASGALATMLVTHRMLGTWRNLVPGFIALTEFSRRKFIEFGLPADKIYVKQNFVPDSGPGRGGGDYALFVGRLSPEKGIDVLLEAWRKGGMPRLKIVGEGPLEGRVRDAAREIPEIDYIGKLPLSDVLELMGEASMTVIPSIWYETFGRTVIESYSKGTPVVVSDIGAVGSIVRDNATGLLFRPGDAEHLREQVLRLHKTPNLRHALGEIARSEYEALYTPQRNYELLMDIYGRVLERFRAERPSAAGR